MDVDMMYKKGCAADGVQAKYFTEQAAVDASNGKYKCITAN
jgi:hypothetical protein